MPILEKLYNKRKDALSQVGLNISLEELTEYYKQVKYVRNNYRSKSFEFLTYKSFPTDNSLMSLTVAKAILESEIDWNNLFENAVKSM